jgi:hypothetical protein
MNKKIELEVYFTNATLESENPKYFIVLNEIYLKYVLICQVKITDTNELQNRYDIYNVKKSYISSLDYYEDSEGIYVVRLNISGRQDDILIPFEESEQGYKVYLELEKWLFDLE